MSSAVTVFISLCGLLVIGKFARLRIPLLQQLYLPSSVIGGVIGLAVMSMFGDCIDPEIPDAMRRVPGFLINVVFATLFLGKAIPNIKRVVSLAFPQLVLGQIVAWGQYVVGLGLAGFLLTRLCGVPPCFGNLIEIGFEGGHGTVGGMTESFLAAGWSDGAALGFTVATAGMVVGIVVGMVLVNWAQRRGIVHEVVPFGSRRFSERLGVHPRRGRPAAGLQTVMSDSIDSLAWHLAIVGVSIAIGAAMLAILRLTGWKVFSGFPLFPLCMIGGIVLQSVARLVGKDLLVDHGQMERISGAALDFLVVSAVTTISIKVVAANWIPLLVIIAAGTVWSVFAILWFGPRCLKEAWFERAIADFGQATGVTATGLLLLRTVDPDSKTCAAASFGYKQLLHEPFMGGGLWTAFAFTLVIDWGWMKVFVISCAMLAAWVACAFFLMRGRKR
jgi:ESS family glutamate:Na+ symporter